jgi:hypothetical protein
MKRALALLLLLAAAPALADSVKQQITIEQGATWRHGWKTAINLTGCSLAMEVRTAPGGTLLASPLPTTTSASRGEFTTGLTALQTGQLAFTTPGYYDVEATCSGTVYRLFEGTATLALGTTTDEVAPGEFPAPGTPPGLLYCALAGCDITGAFNVGGTEGLWWNPTFHAVGIGQDPNEDLSTGPRLLVEWDDPTDVNQDATRASIVARGEIFDNTTYSTIIAEGASNPATSSAALVDGIFGRMWLFGTQTRTAAQSGIRANVEDQSTASISSIVGMNSVVIKRAAGGTADVATGVKARVQNSTSGGVITNARGVHVEDGEETGTIVNRAGVVVEEQSGATTSNVNILSGTSTAPAGDWDIYSESTKTSRLNGPLVVGRSIAAVPSLISCTSSLAGAIVYVDDTNDGAVSHLCFCGTAADDSTYGWRRADAPGTACP